MRTCLSLGPAVTSLPEGGGRLALAGAVSIMMVTTGEAWSYLMTRPVAATAGQEPPNCDTPTYAVSPRPLSAM